jgi:hypothetical protein
MASGNGQIPRLSFPPAAGHRRALLLVCTLLIGATVILNQSAVHWRENVVDSHLFAWHGWCVAQGERPYIDIWDNKPPGIWWLNAAGFWVCGEGFAGEVLISATALAVALIAFTATARAAYQPSLLLIAALTGCALLPHSMYEGGANRTETFVLACESAAVCGYVCWLRRRRWPWLIAAGLAAGAAPLFKQSGLAAAAGIGVHLTISLLTAHYRRARGNASPGQCRPSAKAVLLFAAGCGIAPALALAALAAQGAVVEAWHAVAVFNRVYFEANDATYLRVDRALHVFGPALVPLGGVSVAAVIGPVWRLTAALVERRRRTVPASASLANSSNAPSRTYVELFWLWFVFAAYLACVGPGRRGHHFLPALAPLGLLALYPVHLLASSAGLGRRVTAHPSSAAIVVAYLYVLALLVSGTATEIGRCWRSKSHWYSLEYAAEPPWQQQAALIRRYARSDEAIYVWGWSPGTYRYAYRRCAARFATFEKVGQLGRRVQFILESALDDLRRNPPRVFVISRPDLAGVMRTPSDEFAQWLSTHYEDRGVTAGMHIMTAR